MPAATAAVVIYFLLIGGTPVGELIGTLRVANTAIGATLIGYLVLRCHRYADAIDRLVVAALLLVAASAMASPFPRQAVDGLVAAMAYVALFLIARELLTRASWLRGVVIGMRAMSVAAVLVAALRMIPAAYQWWSLTGEVPPLRLPLYAGQWGHAYDLLLLGVMLIPSWFVPPRTRDREVAGAVIAAVHFSVIFLKGARAIWLAGGFATLVGVIAVWDLVRNAPRRLLAVGAVVVAAAVLLAVALGGPILERLLTSATVEQRVEMWRAAIDAWAQRPVLGFGPNTFPWILQSTDYFDTNSLHPRHPDSALFQLIPEMGVAGIVAATLVLLAIGVPLVRQRRYLPLWPLLAFVAAGVGANPTDFAFLVVVAVLWAAYGLPRRTEAAGTQPARWFRPVLATGFAFVGVFVVATLAAGVAYDDAKRAADAGSIDEARGALDVAVSLDPNMALYSRQRGIANLLLGDYERAVSDLERATRTSPQDDLSWRALGVAAKESGDSTGARYAVERAVATQRSDPANLLLMAAWQAEAGDSVGLRSTAAELILGWPEVIAAPGWSDLVKEVGTGSTIDDAVDRWLRGDSSPRPIREQLLILVALGSRDELFEAAAALTGESMALARATVAVYTCDPDASRMLDAIPPSDRRSKTFWALRIQEASEAQRSDLTALQLYRLIEAQTPTSDDWSNPMNPLHENNSQGSVDAWGYDRPPIAWPEGPTSLPLPAGGKARWLLDPSAAREEAGIGVGACAS